MTVPFETLAGKTITHIDIDYHENTISITTSDNCKYRMNHIQDCCETVVIKQIDGDILDLTNTPIILAEEVAKKDPYADESGTYTFYKLGTVKGYVTIAWHGTSNGYYSETVDFSQIN